MSEMSTPLHAFNVLDRLPARLLWRVLEPYEVALREVGLDPSDLDLMAFWQARDALPRELVDAIHDLELLSDDVGHVHLIEVILENGGTLCDELPEVRAATLLVEQPKVFKNAVRGRSLEPGPPLYEQVGRSVREPTLTGPSLRDLENSLRPFLVARGHLDFCQVDSFREGDLVYFVIRHAQHLRREQEVVDGVLVQRDRRPVGVHVVVLDLGTGDLRLGARHVAYREHYRVRFGVWLAADPEWFGAGVVVNLARLVDRPDEVLAPTPGLLEVRIVEIGLDHRGPTAGTLRCSAMNALAMLREFGTRLGRAEPARFVTLAFRHAADGLWRTVTVGLAGLVTDDWRWGQVHRRFLEERAILTARSHKQEDG